MYEYYSLYRKFSEDKKKLSSSSKKLSEIYIDFDEKEL